MVSNLHKKLVTVAKNVQYIQKKGMNSFQRYSYAKESDILSKFSKEFTDNGIALTTSVIDRQVSQYESKNGDNSFLVSVKIEMNFIDSETGEKETITGYGDGSDKGDKGIYKAITGAVKYALMKSFLVETGDDPEYHKPENISESAYQKAIDYIKSDKMPDVDLKNEGEGFLEKLEEKYTVSFSKLESIRHELNLSIDRKNEDK